MNIKRVPISSVIPWEDNPRGIRMEDYERLKKQILELGVYKPLVVCKEKGKYLVLGGNMRIRALKELGIREVEVSIVEAKTQAQKIKFALSDNDRAGFYEEEHLAELVFPHIKDLDLGTFKIDLGESLTLKQLVERFGPSVSGEEGDAGINYEPKFAVTVECADEASQRETFDALVALGYKCRVVVV